jgi:hypothetical protein
LIGRHSCRRRGSHRHGDGEHQHAMRDGVTTSGDPLPQGVTTSCTRTR